MPTCFRRYLIFEDDSGETGGDVTLEGSFEVHGVAIAVVGVADDWNGDSLSDELTLIKHFAVRDETSVR